MAKEKTENKNKKELTIKISGKEWTDSIDKAFQKR